MINDMRILLLLSVFLSATGIAQEPGSSPADPARKAETPAPQVQAPQADAQKWIQQLGSDSYRDRLEAENKLREMGEKSREALQAAAQDGRDGEAQWRAKRLLRQLDGAGLGSRESQAQDRDTVRGDSGLRERRRSSQGSVTERGTDQDMGGVEDMRSEFDRLFRRMEQQHGIDIPRHRFFDDTFFKDLRSQMDRDSNGRSVSVQVTPDGVHVEVTETGKDGKPQTKTYDAEDMESFHKKHPGVLQENSNGLGLRAFGRADMSDLFEQMRVDVGAPQRGFEWRMLQPKVVPFDQGGRVRPRSILPPSAGAEAEAAIPPNGARLGVVIKPIPEALRDYLELAADTGLMIETVQEDTLAVSLQLRAGDIVTSINGQNIASPADVQQALRAVKKGDSVKLDFIRRGERRHAETKKLHDAEPARAELKPSDREPSGREPLRKSGR